MEGIASETVVRMNASQTAKGLIQLDVSATAPTIEKARELLGQAIDALVKEVESRGFALTNKVVA
jgi:G:T/U-mismatch repair DNA glycosylase